MKRIYTSAIATGLLALSSACGSNDDFRVLGNVENLGTQNLRVAYTTENAIKSFTTTAIDGKFSFTGESPKETLVEIFTTDRAPLGYVIIKNGQTVKATFDRDNRYNVTLKGNSASSDLAEFMRDNADVLAKGTVDEVNAAVAEYIGNNRKNMASTVLLLTQFTSNGHEAETDSLLELIDLKARPQHLCAALRNSISERIDYDTSTPVVPMNLFTAADSLTAYNPAASAASLIVFTSRAGERNSELRRILSELADNHKSRELRIMDVSMEIDTAEWRRAIAHDSATWTQVWVPGGMTAPGIDMLRIPHTPFYIVADSTGHQLYRGSSMDSARQSVTDALSR